MKIEICDETRTAILGGLAIVSFFFFVTFWVYQEHKTNQKALEQGLVQQQSVGTAGSFWTTK